MASHRHEHVEVDEADWADHLELEGEVLAAFVTEAAALVRSHRGAEARPVHSILDVGSGPGVGTCELARVFPAATVIAVDASPAMLDRVTRRATSSGLGDRVRTQLAELPDGVHGLGLADVIWASMSLHHVGDEIAALRAMRDLLAPEGLLAIAERDEPMRVLPTELDFGQPGLAERLARADEEWFAAMRAGLPGSRPSTDLRSMLEAAGFAVAEESRATVHLDAPLPPEGRRLALAYLRRAVHQLAAYLAADDLAALATLADVNDPRGLVPRPALAIAASRRIMIAGPRPVHDDPE